MEAIAAELLWGRHVGEARRLAGEGRFSEAERELWIAELGLFGLSGADFLREEARRSRLDLRRRPSILHVRCDGERVPVFRVP
jgi:hypothetical protein